MSYSPEFVIKQLERKISRLEERLTISHFVTSLLRSADSYDYLIRQYGTTSPKKSIDLWMATAARDRTLSKDRTYLELALTRRKAVLAEAKAELALMQYRQKVAS